MIDKPSFFRRHHTISIIVLCAVCLTIGGFATWGFAAYLSAKYAASQVEISLRLPNKDNPLINPLLLCSVENKNFNEDKKLESTIKSFISDHIARGLIGNMSVYLINYKTGQWAGVNQNDRYDPASMLKVPIMIAYYKNVEKNPVLLSQELAYTGVDQNSNEYFKSGEDIQPNKTYTAEQLIESMIIHSDNTAADLLQNSIDQTDLFDIFTDLGLPIPSAGANIEYMSAKSYAYFFRLLYNATYVSDTYSEKALELLSQAVGPGIKDGVPAGVTVAQKFGERTIYDSSTGQVQDRELHDCGIVYKPNSPYLLCVMSRGGSDFDTMAKNISDLSSLIYTDIDTQ